MTPEIIKKSDLVPTALPGKSDMDSFNGMLESVNKTMGMLERIFASPVGQALGSRLGLKLGGNSTVSKEDAERAAKIANDIDARLK